MPCVEEVELTRIDRTIQIFYVRRTAHVVSYDDAWVTSEVSALSAQRAQITFSTQGAATHSQARGGEAGAQPAPFHERVLSRMGRLTSLARENERDTKKRLALQRCPQKVQAPET